MSSKKSRGSKKSSRKRSKSRRSQKGKRGSGSSLLGSLSSPLGLSLSEERKRDLLGLACLSLGGIIGWGMFAGNPSEGMELLTGLMQRAFGWGAYVSPFLLIGLGSWLILEDHREGVPRFDGERLVGILILTIGLLILLQAVLGVDELKAGVDQANAGRGGGAIGARLLGLSVRAVGVGGTFVILITGLLIGLTFALGSSLPRLLEMLWRPFGTAGIRAWSLGRDLWLKFFGSPAEVPGLLMKERRVDSSTSLEEDHESPQSAVGSTGSPGQAQEPLHPPAAREPISWTLPDRDEILRQGDVARVDDEYDNQRGKLIEDTLRAFGAPSRIVEVNRGPTITQFGVEPEFIESRGGRRTKVKVSKIASLADDLALALAAPSVRVEAPVPGKGFVGIEVPNTDISLVALRDVISGTAFKRIDSQLRMGLGQDVSGHPVVADLGEMPHLLIAGTTGSGKSVCVNAIIACLLLQNTPKQLQFLMVDPKRVELTNFNGIPHLLAPVIVDLDRVVPALQWLSREMDERYRRFSQAGVRHIDEYNRRMRETEGKELPLLVVMIDELADLMMLAPDETERVITRLAQLARATGIHLVISTQRPSVDVVTGLIKANFPARIAFAVASSVDSRVILDQPGAERLLGRGDMLFQAPDAPAPVRLQGSFVSDVEMRRLIRYWKRAAQGGEVERPDDAQAIGTAPSGVPLKQSPLWEEYDTPDEDLDELFDEAVEIVREMRRGSISLLQRRLRIGYTRAARLIDQMEEREIVGPQKSGSQPREVLDYGEVLEASGELPGGD